MRELKFMDCGARMTGVTLRKWLKIAACSLLGFTLLFWGFHLYLSDRGAFQRAFYPVRAQLVQLEWRCSEGAPSWLAETLEYVISTRHSPANQIAYLAPDGLRHHCENGWVDGVGSPPVAPSNRFRYASLSKLLTVGAVLSLVDAGELELDARLLDLLPEVRPVADERLEEITVEHLLRHAAGFDRLASPDPMFAHGVKPWCPYELDRLKVQALDFSPGSRVAYSNLGYCLLGVIVERVSGESYREYVSRTYGLDGHGIRFVDGAYEQDEVAYDFMNSGFYGRDYSRFFDFQALSSSAGLSGSAVALATVIQGMRRGGDLSILSAEVGPDCDVYRLGRCYGFGVGVYKVRGRGMYINVQSGDLIGAASLAVLDSLGGVTIWVGSGMPPPGASKLDLVDFFYRKLDAHYR